ncbi:MAG: NAD(P)-dependent glycerol-3-phosphate dehydrogenase [Oligoflexia bacterium]|nr:NAD(P)-dependent glycerol-3-phosphate dehydrogenase [Oligoflexia bacterium]
MNKKYKIALVIGSGMFATSMASVLANNFNLVIIKVRRDEIYQMFKAGENSAYLPGIKLPTNVIPALSWAEVDTLRGSSLSDIEIIVSGLPSAAIKEYFADYQGEISRYLKLNIPFVSLTKGIDPIDLKLSDDILFDYFNPYRDLITFLSGPSFAEEILQQQITLVSLAGRSNKTLTQVSNMLNTPFFKLFPTYDIKGVLLGGALKNVLAIAGGIIEELGYNHNTRAALITAGIADMLRFGVVFNARSESFYGFSGMGDLILTTTGNLSRNKIFGMEIARGENSEKNIQEILAKHHTVIEGYQTAKAAQLISERYDIKCKIFNGVYSVLYENANPTAVINNLMDFSSRVKTLF